MYINKNNKNINFMVLNANCKIPLIIQAIIIPRIMQPIEEARD